MLPLIVINSGVVNNAREAVEAVNNIVVKSNLDVLAAVTGDEEHA